MDGDSSGLDSLGGRSSPPVELASPSQPSGSLMGPEYRTVTTLIPRIALGTVAVLVAGSFATNNNVTGSFNKPLYLCVLALAFAITVIFLHDHRSARFDAAVAVVASVGLIWGIWTIERPQTLRNGYWEGFGSHVALAVLVLLLIFGTLLQSRSLSRRVRIGLVVIVAICCAFDVLGAIRTSDYLTYVGNNQNEINDMLGPVTGRFPDSTYIPQYTALYGWLFLPLKSRLSPLALVGAMSIFLTLLDFATVILAVRLARRVLGAGGYLLAAALVVPITYVTSHQLGDTSSIASLFQELPIRLISGFVIIAIGLTDLVLVYRGTVRRGHLSLIGVVCGVLTWNSQDFGLAATVVYGVMILLGGMSSVRRRAIGAWLLGLIIGVASYPLFLLSIRSPLNLSFVAAFVKLFGSGLGAAPMQVPGPVLVVMPLIVCSAAAGWALMRRRRRKGVPPDALLDQATVTLTFMGTWSLLGLLYYVNRAYAEGQLQTMLLPSAVCVAALLSIAIRSDEVRALWRRRPDLTPAQLSGKLKLLPVAILVSLCFSSALLTADPVAAAKSLVNPPAASGFTGIDFPTLLPAIHKAQEYTAGRPGKLSYLGESFNIVSLLTHVPSDGILFPFPPEDLASAVVQIDCRYIETHHTQWIVLSTLSLEVFGPRACGMYQPVKLPGVLYGQLQELK